jgi:hypothetical protein
LKGIGLSPLIGHIKLILVHRFNNDPYSNTVGQPSKVGKKEIVGMLVAVECHLKFDHVSERSLLIFSREKAKS